MIIGIEGGIGTGKTLTMVHYALQDWKKGKTLFSNVKFKGISARIKYLNADMVNNMFEQVKTGKLNINNSTILIQEMHNYADSRTSMSKRNRTLSYWILQSRHTGKGSCDIIYDTQEFGQVDIRLRNNTDHYLRPLIIEYKNKIPSKIVVMGTAKILHKWVKYSDVINVYDDCFKYDTHELVWF